MCIQKRPLSTGSRFDVLRREGAREHDRGVYRAGDVSLLWKYIHIALQGLVGVGGFDRGLCKWMALKAS